MLVFLVDDDFEDHEIFKMAFLKFDPSASIVATESAIEALEYVRENRDFNPDIIFFDVNMPRMNGKECIKELRKTDQFRNTPMILYSTHDGQKEIDEAKEAGASDFMTKPASIPEFTKALQTIVSKHVKSHN